MQTVQKKDALGSRPQPHVVNADATTTSVGDSQKRRRAMTSFYPINA
jgi:hypothetical protein